MNYPMAKDRFVSVYRVTRHYGGDEEGGWWYNLNEHVKSSRRLKPRKVTSVLRRWEAEWIPRSRGNIYSVLGGVQYQVTTEAQPGNAATRETPHYE